MSEVFLRDFGEVCHRRFDAEYHKDANITITTYPLKSFVSIRSGKRIPKGETYSHTITPYKYLRVEDLDSESLEIDINNLKSIDENIFKLLSRYEIHNDEIALSIAGTIGKIFLFRNHTNNQVILTENCVKLQAINSVLPKFLSIVLKTSFLQNQMKRQYIQTTIPKLAIERIKELQIPQIPNKQAQQQIIDIMDNAYQVKKDKEQQAKELLDSIDEYLLDELGIVMPAKSNNTLENRIFMQSFSNISDTRFDPSYHQKYYQDLEKALQKAKYPLVKLAEKLLINNVLEDIAKYEAINYIDLSSIDKENGIIENIKNINNNFPSRARQKVCKGDLLVSTLSGSMKAIAIVNNSKENLIASTGFFVIRHTNGLLKDFLMFLLRINLFQELLKRESSGAIMASINQNKFLNLKIPLPSLTEQKRIANEIRQRQERAKKLQQEAKEILESAKKQVESIILGG